jgi:hypothetical protein
MNTKTVGFWDVTPCRLVDGYIISEQPVAFVMYPENGGRSLLQTVYSVRMYCAHVCFSFL